MSFFSASSSTPFTPATRLSALALALCAPAGAALAQPAAQNAAGPGSDAAWRRCSAMTGDSNARLACFDRWARGQEKASDHAPTWVTLD